MFICRSGCSVWAVVKASLMRWWRTRPLASASLPSSGMARSSGSRLYTVTDLQGHHLRMGSSGTTPSRFMFPIARAGSLKPGTALAAVTAGRIVTHDQVHEFGCLAGPAVGTGVLRCAYRCRAVVARSSRRAPAGRLAMGRGTTTRGEAVTGTWPARCSEPGSWGAGWWAAPSRRGCLHP